MPGASGDPLPPGDDVVFDLRVDDHPEPLAELHRLHRMAAGYRRRNRIGAGALVEEEIEAGCAWQGRSEHLFVRGERASLTR